MFIRKQHSPYCVTATRVVTMPSGMQWEDDIIVPAMKFSSPAPQWRSADGVWGPDEYGYTEFDDYHLSQYGA